MKVILAFLCFLLVVTLWSYSTVGAAQANLEPQDVGPMTDASCSSSTSTSGGQ
jgi:hypothetical protein